MDIFRTTLCCFMGGPEPMTAQHSDVVNEKKRLSPSLAPYSPVSERAPAVARVLRLAEKKGVDLTRQLNDTVGPAGWSEWLARDILTILEATLREGREKMGPAMRQAYDNALRAAESDFWELVQQAKDHPLETAAAVLITIIAIGVLVELAPFLLEWLGFARAGPVADTFASWWQSTYKGFVPAGSMFSYLQRLGMVWTSA